ncbi:MAG: SusC/RagA family TonB-linked outer membrane protein [Dysgonamonadaceae bacterium]|nr:SusC/RagA family TonB-linked outer membrane protein [Dysgonamonadaceae bacterium]
MTKNKFCINYACIGLIFFLLFAGLNFANASSLSVETANAVETITQQQGYQITGTVVDNYGEELIGVAVQLKSNPAAGAVTDLDGRFTLRVGSMNETLVFSYVGMKTMELRLVAGTTNYNVTMESDDTVLSEVVVMGIMERDRAGFTGAVNSLAGDEIRTVGNINLLQSLRSLDPSFVVMDNVLEGSNPNSMATIELRGRTGLDLGDGAVSNMPLFLIDGFEVTIQEVNDLDINRIASVTLLKDASSTAIFGSKGANGVVVIETVRPAPGRVSVSYSTNQRLSWADLSQYNMMNARDKLDFEHMAGLYGNINNVTNIDGINAYNAVLRRIEMGADTDWMRMPIRVGLTNNHSVNVSGGDNIWLFTTGISYRNEQGVMKGSNRDSYSGNIRVTYRGVNNLNISNNLTVNGVTGQDGSWGSYHDFVRANPHQVPYDLFGTLLMFVDGIGATSSGGRNSSTFLNPLWNATLYTYGDTKEFTVTNNTNINWQISDNLRVEGNLQLRQQNSGRFDFTDPRHTKYASVDYTEQGTYRERNHSTFNYNADTRVSYGISINNAHNFTFIGRAALEESTSQSSTFVAKGFPLGAEPIPSFAYSYEKDSRPSYSWNNIRRASFSGMFNYNYMFRYLFDASVSHDGSTVFGSNNPFKSFYSFGAGWNIHREAFAQDWNWVNELKARASYGTNGNQQADLATSTVYGFHPGSDLFGTASRLDKLGNPNLQWISVSSKGVGIDAAFINNRLRLSADIYERVGDPQAISLPQKASTGITSVSVNLGRVITQGYEFRVSYALINNVRERKMLTVRATGGGNNSKYYGFGDVFNLLNNEMFNGDEATLQTRIMMFQDGYRQDDMWAVRSLGIDPATGREIFLKKDGTPTYTWSQDDRVRIAQSNPVIRGTLGANLIFKQLEANINLGYQLGGHILNRALFDRVENISGEAIAFNQDRRALTDRWFTPGDVKQFRSPSLSTNTPLSSRFIQKSNRLTGESVNISWNFSQSEWIKMFALQTLTMGVSMNDIFYLSPVRAERSINYPFARAVSFNLNARF